jgi:hypothetical protein
VIVTATCARIGLNNPIRSSVAERLVREFPALTVRECGTYAQWMT